VISIIIPTHNEESIIESALDSLRALRGEIEIIIADGSSSDGTAHKVNRAVKNFPQPLRLVVAEHNRGLQLNRAAGQARGDVLLFLHADARLGASAVELIESATAKPEVAGGSFRLKFEGHGWSTFFTWVDRTRRAFGIYYGDSGIFVRRTVFERLGGFITAPVMEDYEFTRRLERFARRERLKTVCLPAIVLVSDRRWRLHGAWRTMWTWFWLQVVFSAGVSPQRLARWYRPARKS
jgi:rSAM/selenodomain-associated transferase 2